MDIISQSDGFYGLLQPIRGERESYYTTKKGAEEADFTLDYIKDKHQEIGI